MELALAAIALAVYRTCLPQWDPRKHESLHDLQVFLVPLARMALLVFLEGPVPRENLETLEEQEKMVLMEMLVWMELKDSLAHLGTE